MEKRFLMQHANPLSSEDLDSSSHSSPCRWPENEAYLQYRYGIEYFRSLIPQIVPPSTRYLTISELDELLDRADSLGLMGEGTISRFSFLGFLALSNVLQPDSYVESGVFVGSSLFVFDQSKDVRHVWGIDPNLGNLRFSCSPKTRLVAKQDFSECAFPPDVTMSRHLVYFDDHINTAARIVQAAKKGFRLLVFDDSNGLAGIQKRLFPAMPTLPLIMNHDQFADDEVIEWLWRDQKKVRFVFTKELKELCAEAKALIEGFFLFPPPATFISSAPALDEKYLVVLKGRA